MPSKERYLEEISKEFTTAQQALSEGNEGKARVCSRRAAGIAITWYLSKVPRPGWHADALHQLLHLKDDTTFSPEVRDAALRLTTKISGRFAYPFSTNPIADARIIVDAIISQLDSDGARGI